MWDSLPVRCVAAISFALIVSVPTVRAQTERPQDDAGAPTNLEAERQEKLDAALQEVVGELDTIVMTATRHEQRVFDTPYHAHITAGNEVRRARNFQDALRQTPGVHMQRTSYGQSSPFLRGFTAYHTLLMVDGIRLNNSVLRSGPNEYWGLVDGYSLDRIETVFGPGSVLYGSDAVGGTVNAIPVRRRDFGPESSWNRRLAMRYSSAEQSIIGRAQVSGNVGEHLGFVIGATGGAFSDLDAGGPLGPQPGTNFHNYFADARIEYRFDDSWSVGLLAQIGRLRNIDRVHRTTKGVSFAGTSVGSDRSRDFDWDRDLVGVFIDGVDLDASFIDEIHVRLSWHHITEDQVRTRGDGRVNDLGWDTDTFGAAVTLVSETSIGRFTYGADYYHDSVDSFRTDYDAMGVPTVRIQGPVGDDSTYDLLGIFVQDEVALSDDFDLIVGGRFTYAAADADRVEDPNTGNEISVDDDWVDAVGSIRLLWRATDEVNIFGGFSQAFRAPNLSDISRLDFARSNEIEVAATGLDPERFYTFEVGGKVLWGGLSAEATYHYTIVDDLIVRSPTGAMIMGDAVVTKSNVGDGHMQGVEIRARYDFCENWWVFGSFQWFDGQHDTFPTSAPVASREGFSKMPPLGGTFGFGWRTNDRKFYARAWAVMTADQERLNTRDRADRTRIPPRGTPGYVTLNAEAGYQISPNSNVFLSIENILDKNYRQHGSGVQEPGVNVVVGADITF